MTKTTPVTLAVNTLVLRDEPVQTVNARNLHADLGVKKDFSNWVKDQIDRAGLVEGEDYITAENLSTPGKASANSTGEPSPMARARITIDYHLTVESAKHVAMMSNTARGKEVRQYFINLEKDAKSTLYQELLQKAKAETEKETRQRIADTGRIASSHAEHFVRKLYIQDLIKQLNKSVRDNLKYILPDDPYNGWLRDASKAVEIELAEAHANVRKLHAAELELAQWREDAYKKRAEFAKVSEQVQKLQDSNAAMLSWAGSSK